MSKGKNLRSSHNFHEFDGDGEKGMPNNKSHDEHIGLPGGKSHLSDGVDELKRQYPNTKVDQEQGVRPTAPQHRSVPKPVLPPGQSASATRKGSK